MYSLPLYSVHYSVNVLYNSAHTQEIMTALAMNETLRELRIANQYNAVGAGDEMAMSKLVGNTHLTKLSMNWRNTGSRNTSDRFIMRNTDLGKLGKLSVFNHYFIIKSQCSFGLKQFLLNPVGTPFYNTIYFSP